jgi:hypothetical protein
LVYAGTAIVTFLFTFAFGVLISPIGFSLEGMGHGKVIDGGGGFFCHRYTSTYFINLWFSGAGYPSPEKANEVFANAVGSAVKVIERGPRYDQHGRVVGQRAVAILLDTENNEQYSSVFWTDGKVLFSISSRSMTHVLQFERHRMSDFSRTQQLTHKLINFGLFRSGENDFAARFFGYLTKVVLRS